MLKVNDFVILKDLEIAPDGLYQLKKTDIHPYGLMLFCFKSETGAQVICTLDDLEMMVEKIMPVPQNSKIKLK